MEKFYYRIFYSTTLKPKYFTRNILYPNAIPELRKNTPITIVIPAYKEPDLLLTLKSILSCELNDFNVEVIIVNNLPFGSTESEVSIQNELNNSITELNRVSQLIKFYPLAAFDLPPDQMGAGLARKIGMDIAANRYFDSDESVQLIVGLDADCLVDNNYLIELYKFFNKSKANGASIFFEHPLSGNLPDINYKAITSYELHLRYYNLMMRYIGFPNAFHTYYHPFHVLNKPFHRCPHRPQQRNTR